MALIAFVPTESAADTIAQWARVLSQPDEPVRFLCAERDDNETTAAELKEAFGDGSREPPVIDFIDPLAPVGAVLEQVRKSPPRLLLVAPFSQLSVDGAEQTSDELIRAAPCQTFSVCFGRAKVSGAQRVLFIASGGGHDRAGLQAVDEIRKKTGLEVTIGYVEEETGAAPGEFGKNAIRILMHDLSLDESDYRTRVVTDRLEHRGILELYEGQDLIVAGWDSASRIRPLRESLGEATAVLFKRVPPLRIQSIIDWFPRINPKDHADLILQLRLGSLWAPDFIVMLSLAAGIASLGLLQNSPAVVIGSMLLAPLMTPMIGAGLAISQANKDLTFRCGKTIFFGFLLTLGISFLMGFVTPAGATLTEEVMARGGPNVLDLLIAVFAASAATYSMARPNITGALAGVAIATALVPPVCSVGISLAHGAPMNAFGAALLFLTNLIAIIVMSGLTFNALGITSARALPKYRRRARSVQLSFIAMLVLLVGPLSEDLLKQIRAGKNVAAAHPVTQELHEALFERVAQDEGVEIMYLARPRAENRVLIHLASREELPEGYAAELEKVVHDTTGDDRTEVTVVAVRGLWRVDSGAEPGKK